MSNKKLVCMAIEEAHRELPWKYVRTVGCGYVNRLTMTNKSPA